MWKLKLPVASSCLVGGTVVHTIAVKEVNEIWCVCVGGGGGGGFG